MRRLFFLCAAPFVLLLLASPSAAATYRVRIDPRVLQDTAANQAGRFLVILKPQADRRIFERAGLARVDRRRAAFNSLRQTAEGTQPAVRAELDRLGAKYHSYWVVNLFAVEGTRAVVDSLARRSDIAAIESDQTFHVALEQAEGTPRAATGIEWNIDKIGAPAAWAKGVTGQGVVYANADTGVMWNHPALLSHYRGWNGTTADHNYNWWDAVHEDLNGEGNPCNPGGFGPLPGSGSLAPCDDYGHGTHTMGIGVGDDGLGNQIGVAPGAKWMACRNMEQGDGRPSTYLECFQFFLAPTDLNGGHPDPSKSPDVIGNSYVCPPSEGCSENSLEEAMNNLRAAGIFMAVSAGNEGPSCSTIADPPAIYDSAITVGATDSNDNIAGFSSRGPSTVNSIQLRKPDLSAPGVGVWSSWQPDFYPFSSYAYESGTSMAAPHVAGAVALLWSAFSPLRGDVDLTESILEQSALPRPTALCSDDGQVPNNVYGYGRIDVFAAYQQALDQIYPIKYYFPQISK